MRVVIAPDKLKGTLSSAKAGEALGRGARAAGAEIEVIPLADGGEGSLDVWVAPGREVRRDVVTGASGKPVEARWGLGAGVAFLESAEVIGPRESNVALAERTSFGLGELVQRALDAGATSIIVALGGSSTSDAGIGMAQALGVRFEGAHTPATARDLQRVTHIDSSALDPRLAMCDLVAACDVLNPLVGARGAALAFAGQKGATSADAHRLDLAMQRFASLAGSAVDVAGSGAAGGIGFALATFAGAELVSGADLLLDHVRFDERIRGADLVLGAEGKLDAQSLEGKLIAKVARRARSAGIPVAVVAGRVELSPLELEVLGVSRAWSLVNENVTEDEAMRDAEPWLERAAETIVREHAR